MGDKPFDMPALPASFEERGGWVLKALMEDFDLSREAAAGIIGNVGFESSPLVSGSAGGYGWAQWTGPRRRAYEAWCVEVGLDPASDRANYNYMCEELSGDYGYCLIALRNLHTVEECVFTFGRLYEAPYGTTKTHLPGYDGRLAYARRALAGYQAGE
jgi:hypothetical protein